MLKPTIGINRPLRASSLVTISCICLWIHHVSLPSPPLVPYLMRAPVLGQVGVLRVPR